MRRQLNASSVTHRARTSSSLRSSSTSSNIPITASTENKNHPSPIYVKPQIKRASTLLSQGKTSKLASPRRYPRNLHQTGLNVSSETQQFEKGRYIRLMRNLQSSLYKPEQNIDQIQKGLVDLYLSRFLHALPLRLLAAANSAAMTSFTAQFPPAINSHGVKSSMHTYHPIPSTSARPDPDLSPPTKNLPSDLQVQAALALASIGFWDLLRAVMQTLLSESEPSLVIRLFDEVRIFKGVGSVESQGDSPGKRDVVIPLPVDLVAISQEVSAAYDMRNRLRLEKVQTQLNQSKQKNQILLLALQAQEAEKAGMMTETIEDSKEDTCSSIAANGKKVQNMATTSEEPLSSQTSQNRAATSFEENEIPDKIHSTSQAEDSPDFERNCVEAEKENGRGEKPIDFDKQRFTEITDAIEDGSQIGMESRAASSLTSPISTLSTTMAAQYLSQHSEDLLPSPTSPPIQQSESILALQVASSSANGASIASPDPSSTLEPTVIAEAKQTSASASSSSLSSKSRSSDKFAQQSSSTLAAELMKDPTPLRSLTADAISSADTAKTRSEPRVPDHLLSLARFQDHLHEIIQNKRRFKLEQLMRNMMQLRDGDTLFCDQNAWLRLLQAMLSFQFHRPIVDSWQYVTQIIFKEAAPPAQFWHPVLSSQANSAQLLKCWNELVKLDVIPDGDCYCAFITGAFKFGVPDIAMSAFSEFSKRFSDLSTISQKMNVIVVQGLLRTRGKNAAESFMKDLTPNQKTLDFFNSLMAYHAGRGDVQGLSQLLSQMLNNNVQPSKHTFALMLAGMILKAESPQEVSSSLQRLLVVIRKFPSVVVDAKFYAITLRVLVQQNVTEAQLQVAIQLLKETFAANLKVDAETLIKIFSNGIRAIANDNDRRVFARTMLSQFHDLGHVLHPKLVKDLYRLKPYIELLDWLSLASVDKLPSVEAWHDYLKIVLRFDREKKLAREAVTEIRRRRVLELHPESRFSSDVKSKLRSLMESI